MSELKGFDDRFWATGLIVCDDQIRRHFYAQTRLVALSHARVMCHVEQRPIHAVAT
jgi:hypothetical protein